MKFLLCGCFHGRVPNKLIKIAKKEKVDYILSTGDFYSGDVFRDLIFKYFDKTKGTDFLLKEIIGAKRYNKLVKKRTELKDEVAKVYNDGLIKWELPLKKKIPGCSLWLPKPKNPLCRKAVSGQDIWQYLLRPSPQ